jgi:hypothetical protein
MRTWEPFRTTLEANVGRPVRLTLSDETCIAIPVNTDDDGFVYDVEDGGTSNPYWSRFEDVISIDPIELDS